MSTKAKSLSITGLIIATIIATFVVVSCTTRESGPAKNTQGVQGTPIATDTPSAPTAKADPVVSKGNKIGLLGRSNPYTVVYERARYGIDGMPYMVITVKGPAKQIVVILTQPDGREESVIVQKEQMITNSREVYLLLSEKGREIGGNYILRVKTIDPESVVFKETISTPPNFELASAK